MILIPISPMIAEWVGKLQKLIKRLVRDSLKWMHLLGVCVLLRCFSDHTLETFIIIMFMYEVGFEFTAIDRLMEYNNKIRSWLLRKFSIRRKKNAKRNYSGPI